MPPEVSAKASPAPTPVATPDNTPLPGGGSWHWDYTASRWVENMPTHQTTSVPITETPQE